jgi:hypothetical protein
VCVSDFLSIFPYPNFLDYGDTSKNRHELSPLLEATKLSIKKKKIFMCFCTKFCKVDLYCLLCYVCLFGFGILHMDLFVADAQARRCVR